MYKNDADDQRTSLVHEFEWDLSVQAVSLDILNGLDVDREGDREVFRNLFGRLEDISSRFGLLFSWGTRRRSGLRLSLIHI